MIRRIQILAAAAVLAVMAAAGLYAASLPASAPTHSGLSQGQMLGYIADNTQRIATGSGVATLPASAPSHSGLSQGQLLGYIADYTQDTQTAVGNASAAAAGTTDSGKLAKYDSYGYLRAKRFATASGSTGTLSSETGYTDNRTVSIITTTATLTAASDTITTAVAHGRQVGDGIVITTGGSLSGTGLTAGRVYYVASVPTSTTLTIASTPGGATLDITGAGTGTHTFSLASAHAFSDERTILGASGISTDAANALDIIPNVGQISDTGTFNHFAGGQYRPKFYQTTTIAYGWMSAPEIFSGTGRNTQVATLRHIAIADVAENNAGGYYGYCTTQYGMHIYNLQNADYNVSIQSDGLSTRMVHGGPIIIGSNSYTDLNASAKLQVDSTTQGVLLPRMTKAQRDAIASPADGLVLYQTDNTPGLRMRVSSAWVKFTTSADP